MLLGAAALAAGLPACSPSGPRGGGLKVATTFTIIADMARNVAGEAARV